MCEPISMAIIGGLGVATSAAGTGMGLYSQNQAAGAAEGASREAQQLNTIQAVLDMARANQLEQEQMKAIGLQERIDLDSIQRARSQERSQGLVDFASSGVDLDSGGVDMWETSAAEAELRDMDLTRLGAEYSRYDVRQQAEDIRFGAASSMFGATREAARGSNIARANRFQRAGSLLGGAGQVSSQLGSLLSNLS